VSITSLLSASVFEFTHPGDLISEVLVPIFPIERAIRCYYVVGEEEVVSMAILMWRCLRLDPADRASAAELLTDRWFEGVDPV
jgi:hypothetical protein